MTDDETDRAVADSGRDGFANGMNCVRARTTDVRKQAAEAMVNDG